MFNYYITKNFIPSNKDYNSYRNSHSVYQTYPKIMCVCIYQCACSKYLQNSSFSSNFCFLVRNKYNYNVLHN